MHGKIGGFEICGVRCLCASACEIVKKGNIAGGGISITSKQDSSSRFGPRHPSSRPTHSFAIYTNTLWRVDGRRIRTLTGCFRAARSSKERRVGRSI